MNPLRFVLLNPREGGNVGSAARALKNFAHPDWAIVGAPELDREAAARMAVQAHDWLEAARTPPSLDDAVGDCAWVVGTSSRRRKGMRRLHPREFAVEAVQRMGQGGVALVFGEERSGLSNDELDRCHDVTCLPTDDAQPSVNLAQAIMLYAYELRLALDTAAPAPLLPRAATDAEMQLLSGSIEALLGDHGFLTHDPRPVLRTLLDPLQRSRLTQHEWRSWMAAIRSVHKRSVT